MLRTSLFLDLALKTSLIVFAFMNRSSTAVLLPLCQLPAGSAGLVRQLAGNAEFCQRVREMGFGESSCVTKISGNGTILCQVNGTRLALSHDAAKNILVEKMIRR